MKKGLGFLLKFVLGVVAILLMVFVVLKLIYNEDLPKGKTGAEADELAYNILEAINHKAFEQAREIHWTFRGVNHYEWQLQNHIVEVSWDDFEVIYYTKNKEKGMAYQGTELLQGEEKEEALNYAINNFNNDSFWLIAPHKLFDPGTTRQLVNQDGKDKLLVQYTSGGSTPGDAYLWEVDDNYKPVAFKMWVSIIPLDGLEAQWDNWQMTDGGFPLPESRSVWGLEIPISGVKVIE
jgi:hypothetical protein